MHIEQVFKELKQREQNYREKYIKAANAYQRCTDEQVKESWAGRMAELAGRLEEIDFALKLLQEYIEELF